MEDATAVPAVVFVHGSGDSAHAWDDVIAQLSGLPCVAVDLPGHGATLDRPGPADMTVADYADAVRAELVGRGLSGVCLVGHSLGSAIALRLAVDYPALVARLVLVGAGARLRVLPALLEAAQSAPTEALRQLTSAGFAPDNAQLALTYDAARPPVAEGVAYRDLAACDRFDMMAELGRVSQPTLVLVGEHDRMTPPKYAAFLRDHIPGAQLVTISGAGHYLNAEAPAAVAAALHEWLTDAP